MNLYLRVEINLGLISRAKHLISSTVSLKSFSEYPVNFSISLFQQLIFFNYFADKIRAAAANYDGLNLRRVASRRAISYKY
jgi:hypothetical protein